MVLTETDLRLQSAVEVHETRIGRDAAGTALGFASAVPSRSSFTSQTSMATKTAKESIRKWNKVFNAYGSKWTKYGVLLVYSDDKRLESAMKALKTVLKPFKDIRATPWL